jgi:hypothetical protein
MTDRELMELAAKAAGVKWDVLYDGPWIPGIGKWNPLTDDGDALRLAVKLNIIVHKGFAYTPTGRLFDCRELTTPIAATRRAIVRAAAEIGKGMK